MLAHEFVRANNPCITHFHVPAKDQGSAATQVGHPGNPLHARATTERVAIEKEIVLDGTSVHLTEEVE